MRRSTLAVLVVVALAATACAGSLHRYRAGLPAAGVVTRDSPPERATGPPATLVAGAETDPQPRASTTTAPGLPAGAAPGAGIRPSAPEGAAPRATGAGAFASAAGAPLAAATPSPGTPAPDSSTASAPAPSRPGVTTGVTRDTLTIGLFYPKTGAYTALVRNAPTVLEAAFEEAGLIHGRKVVLKTYDDGTANPSTIQVEEKRAKDEVFALVSGIGESNVVLAPLADQHRVPLLMGNIDEKVALPLTYAFSVFTFWERQALVLPGFVKNVLGGGSKRIGIVYEGTSTAKAAKDAFKAKAAELGLQVVFEQPIAQNQSSCANEVSNLQSRQVELVILMNGPLGAICMLRDSRALAYRPIWTGVGFSWNINLVASASGGAADGIRTLGVVTTLETPAGRHYTQVMRKYAPDAGIDEDDAMLSGYAMAQPLLEALRLLGPNPTREGFVQVMETKMNGYDSGYLPPPTFGPGNRSGPLSVSVTACCSDGRWTTPQIGWRPDF